MYTQDTLLKIHTWRQKAQRDELTQEETREIIEHLRQGRVAAVTAQKASKSKSKTAALTDADVDDMLKGL